MSLAMAGVFLIAYGDTHWLAAAHNISGGTQRLATAHNRWHGWSTAAWQWSTVQQTAHSATATSRGFWCHAILVAARHWSGGNKATVDIILCHSFLSGGQLFVIPWYRAYPGSRRRGTNRSTKYNEAGHNNECD